MWELFEMWPDWARRLWTIVLPSSSALTICQPDLIVLNVQIASFNSGTFTAARNSIQRVRLDRAAPLERPWRSYQDYGTRYWGHHGPHPLTQHTRYRSGLASAGS